jgi:hypothetical protein
MTSLKQAGFSSAEIKMIADANPRRLFPRLGAMQYRSGFEAYAGD